ncbi:dihydrofolate reductase family protein [Microbacterium sp. GXF7504]
MRRLVYGMNVSLDGYVSAAGGGLDWSAPSDELFRWWLQEEQAVTLFVYGRGLWETMSSYWPTGDLQPGATPDEIAFAENWRETPKVVCSSTLGAVGWNARLHTGDAVAEIARLKAGEGGRMRVGGATIAAAAIRAGLVDEYEIVTHPAFTGGGGIPFLPPELDPARLRLIETRTFPGDAVLSRYETVR